MGIFSSIMSKIFHPANATQPTAGTPGSAASVPGSIPGVPGADPGNLPTTAAAPGQNQAAGASVDVEAVLTALAATKGGGGNWRTSIVDLLKMLDLDSSLSARKELAGELNVHAGADGTAEQNVALSKAVWQQLAQNGGKVPASLRD